MLFGFQGNLAFLWDHHQAIQLFEEDIKGGNRPVRASVTGDRHIVAWAAGDQVFISEGSNDS